MSKTDYMENAVLAHTLGKTAYTMPTAYVGLFTAAPTDTTAGTEVTGGSYARVTTAGADWTVPSGGTASNANAITFPTATGSWGTVTHFGIFDASSGGNLLRYGTLTTSRAVGTGEVISFAAGALVVEEN